MICFKVGGALTSIEQGVYVERAGDHDAIMHLSKMDYLLIIEPRQQGKTSLINHLMDHFGPSAYLWVYVDVTTLDRSSEKNWYHTLYNRVLPQIKRNLSDLDAPILENSSQWRQFLSAIAKECLKNHLRLVIALDEVGAADFPNSVYFFSVLRDVYNSRQLDKEFSQLTFLLSGAFHPRDLIKDPKISPFNIAHRIRLRDFDLPQTESLTQNLERASDKSAIANRIHHWTNGQPYLTQWLCHYLDSIPQNISVEDVDKGVENLRVEDSNNIPSVMDKLYTDDALREYVLKVQNGERTKFYPAQNNRQAQLELIGIIKADADGYCQIRNRIYRKALVQEFIPNSTTYQHVNTLDKVHILFLAADPTDAARLRLGREFREIQEQLRSAQNIVLEIPQLSVRTRDISWALLNTKPQIVHFAGHGSSDGALCFENQAGQTHPVSPVSLATLFEQFTDQVNCVLLNACYSEHQAIAIAQHINFVIGMSAAISDESAIAFAIGFYQALGAGRSIEDAYKFGCAQVGLEEKGEHKTPVLIRKRD